MAAKGAGFGSLSFRSFVLAAIIFHATLGYAGTFRVYGPQTYVRQSGAPVVVTNTFAVANLNTQFTLHVLNGGLVDGEFDLVSSTVITVNGVEVVAPNDLNQNMPRLDKPVQLGTSNTISVEVRGKPGGALSVEITGADNDAPIISLAVSPPANTFGWNNTDVLVTFACLDQLSGIAFCPTAVNATMQGANQTVSGTASDRAGNAASAAVILNIDKTAPGISAVLAPPANAAGWNNYDVAVSFNCADALSGIATCAAPVNLLAEGANQSASGSASDRAGNTAATTVSVSIDKTPPSITGTASPAANANGWNKSDVTVSFACTDMLSGVASCPAGEILSSEGDNQTVSGNAADVAGNAAAAAITVRIDKTPPVISVSSPLNGATVSSSNLTVSGTAADGLSGLTSVTCNGTAATVASADFQCGLSLVSGSNSILVQATDMAGNVALSTLSVIFGAVLEPPPTAVFVTPSKFAMLLGETRQLALVDELGRTLPATSWTVNDPTFATVAADGTVTPLAAGEVAVTGTFESLSAQAQLFVTPGEAFEVGAVRWLVEPLPGNSVISIFPGHGGTDTTSVMIEGGSSGGVIRAFNQDGVQQWMYRLARTGSSGPNAAQRNLAAAEFADSGREIPWRSKRIRELKELREASSASGSLKVAQTTGLTAVPVSGASIEVVATAVTDSGGMLINQFEEIDTPGGRFVGFDVVVKVDEHGNELWRHAVFAGELWWAAHPDETVFLVQSDYENNDFKLFALNGITGAEKFVIQLPTSTGVFNTGFPNGLQPFIGSATVGPDGNAYLPIEVLPDAGGPDTLLLLQVRPDGTHSFTQIASRPQCIGPVINPHEVIPVSDGELLVTWDDLGNFCFPRGPAQVVRVSTGGSGVHAHSEYSLGPLTKPLRSYGTDNDGDVVVGENGVAFATDGKTAVAFDSATGALNWVWQPPFQCPNCSPILQVDRALEGNQLLLKDTERLIGPLGIATQDFQVNLNTNGVPIGDPFAGYGLGSNTGIGALYPPSCYVSYIVTDPVSGLLTIILPDFAGPSCGQGFAASRSSSGATSQATFGPVPGLASILSTNTLKKDALDSFWARMSGQSSGHDFLHPFVSFEPFSPQETLLGVPKGSPKKIKVILKPETSASPVELRLKTRTGTGLAQFDPSNRSFNILDPSALPISGFNLGTGDVAIKGITESSTADNIHLEAHPKWPLFGSDTNISLGKLDFSVVSVDVGIRNAVGLQISSDNAALPQQVAFLGQNKLGPLVGGTFPTACLMSGEAVGTVMPSDYKGSIVLKRSVISDDGFRGSTPVGEPNRPATDPSRSCRGNDERPCDDSGGPELRDDDPQSGGSEGKVYDLDSPGVRPVDLNVVYRARINFAAYATLDNIRVSNDVRYFIRVSCTRTMQGVSPVEDVPNDNQFGFGTTPITWDLR